MKTSIITRICVLAASLTLFAGAVGCLDTSPFPEAESAYTLEYHVDKGELLVTFAPQTEVYGALDSITNFSYTIARCELLTIEADGTPTGDEFSGECDALLSDSAQNGNAIDLSFDVPEDKVVDCGTACKAKIAFEILISGEATDGGGAIEDQSVSFVGPHFSEGIDVPYPFPSSGDNGESPEYLDLSTAAVVEDCTKDHEVWSASTSSCVCESGYERDSSTDECVESSGSGSGSDSGSGSGSDSDSDVTDTDGDGIPDDEDNCPEIVNPQQFDVDNDGIGNACEANTSSNTASDADQWGGGSCALNAGAASTSTFDVLPLLMIVSLVAVRRHFRKES